MHIGNRYDEKVPGSGKHPQWKQRMRTMTGVKSFVSMSPYDPAGCAFLGSSVNRVLSRLGALQT